MRVQWFAHLPGVQLEAGGPVNVLEGKVAHLSFAEWCELDPSFPYSEAKYNASRPVFYVGSAQLEGELKDVIGQVGRRIYRFYQAMMLDSRVPLLPDPQLSVHYVRVNLKAGTATYRLVGPFEREWILYGSRIIYPFDAGAIEAVEAVYHLLPDIDGVGILPGIEAGIETLARTARPDTWWDQGKVDHLNDFVHCTAALENLLLSEQQKAEDEKIPAMFGRHAAVLVSHSRKGLDDMAGSYAGLYRLRSKLIYGQMGVSELSESDMQVLRLGRVLLREVLLKSLVLNRYSNGKTTSIARMLKTAYEDDAYHMALHAKLRDVQSLV